MTPAKQKTMMDSLAQSEPAPSTFTELEKENHEKHQSSISTIIERDREAFENALSMFRQHWITAQEKVFYEGIIELIEGTILQDCTEHQALIDQTKQFNKEYKPKK
ncbi:MAG: hypothetical protein R2877_08015 [Bdellovibrionota bacterium]